MQNVLILFYFCFFIITSNVLATDELASSQLKINVETATLPRDLELATRTELSGLIFLTDLQKFIAITDDTNKKKEPFLIGFNTDGRLDAKPFPIIGLPKIKDLESISKTSEGIFLLSSLNSTEVNPSAHLLLWVKNQGVNFTLHSSIALKPLILNAIKSSADPQIKKINALLNGKERLEVEAHFIHHNDLYIPLKGPISITGDSFILKVENFTDLFTTRTLDSKHLKVFATVKFEDQAKVYRISDASLDDKNVYLAAKCKAAPCSAVFSFSTSSLSSINSIIHPTLLTFIPESGLEGIHVTKDRQLWGVFDTSSNYPRYFKAQLPQP